MVEIIFQSSIRAGSHSINIIDVRLIRDSNALTHHMLDVLNTHLYNTRGPLAKSGGGAGAGGFGGYGAASTAHYAQYAESMGAGAGAGSGIAISAGGGGGNSEYDMVLDLFRTHAHDSDEGLSIREVAAHLAKNPSYRHIKPEDVVRISEQLMLDGHIYSTIDESHFKPTA